MIHKALTVILGTAIVCLAVVSWAQTKVDPFLDNALPGASAGKALSISVPPPADSKPVDLFIKSTNPVATAAAVRAAGGRVHASIGSILSASLPSSAIPSIAEDDAVEFLEGAKPINALNDVAGAEIGVPEVHEGGTTLAPGYAGKGVIIGIIDTGIDYQHEDFRDADGNSRILAIWDQSRAGQGPAEISDTYGTECDSAEIADGTCPIVDVEGHGTHVAGIAAGSDEIYGGVASDANIIVVRYDSRLSLDDGYADPIFSTKICEAAYYVFAKAGQMGMPAVINLSLGTHLGAHDGTSLFEQCLAGMTGDVAGRAIVAAAGNEVSTESSFTGIHTGFEVRDNTSATNFVIRNTTRDLIYYIDFWAAKESNLKVGLAIHNGTPSGPPLETSEMVQFGDKLEGTFLGGKVKFLINATEAASLLNGKPHAGIRITLDPALTTPSNFSFDLVVTGTGSFDAWLFPDKPARTVQFTSVQGNRGGKYSYVPGDQEKCIAIPATSPNIIAVAGYATRTRWTVEGLTWTFNGQELSSILKFSSSGPSADEAFTGQKPEIAAPGGMIASTLSSRSTAGSQVLMSDGQHFLQAGTSMAAPFVSGTIALMFQANPNFTQEDTERFLIQSAYVDDKVGAAPNNRWGHGKLNVLGALEIAITGTASGRFGENTSVSLPATDTNAGASSGCALIAFAGNVPGNPLELALVATALVAVMVLRRRAE